MNPITMQQYGQQRIAKARAQADLWREIQRARDAAKPGREANTGRIANLRNQVYGNIRRLGAMLLLPISTSDK